ncbi:hypothetical protein KFE25_014087 [Diacronema lutheri]|uniref:Nuclear speckle splicing regulatory protein 1 N-terminal domain-containing protein n=1 Tax=Diacronema lutheri TaxID=2081491 RepID=A0A8J6C752_DIALT|nr:hypothetical protein KFE25_014087 [Diacronema lutheri]
MDASRVTFGLANKPGLQVGQKGKKYGLVRPAVAGTSIFGAAALEDESAAEQVRRDAAAKHSRADVRQVHDAALSEDPTVFDYDGVYDAMQERRAEQTSAARARDNQPRYMGSIIEAARLRTIENDRVYERKLLKEREVDAELYEDKEKFVTSAYRAKLAERAAHDIALREQAELEARQDVTKRRDLSDFHRNLLFGNPPERGGAGAAAAAAAQSNAPGSLARASTAPRTSPPAPTRAPAAAASSTPPSSPLDGSGGAGAVRGAAAAVPLARGGEAREAPASAQPPSLGPAPPMDLPSHVPMASVGLASREASEREAAAAAVASTASAAKFARRNDDDAIRSARERYLQRKGGRPLGVPESE